jgi:hypothetical protein
MEDSLSREDGCQNFMGFLSVQRRLWEGSVPHSQSGVVPMSSLLGVGLSGFWEFGMGGIIG